MKDGRVGYINALVYDKDGDVKVKGKRKLKTDDDKLVYEDVDSEEEEEAYPNEKIEIKLENGKT